MLNIPKKSDVNWVKSMRIEQQFSQLDNGEWVLTHDDMWAEMSFPALLPNALVTRTTRLAEYKFDDIPRSLLRGKARTIEEANARIRDEEFWQRERPVELTKSEQNIDGLVDRIRRSKGFGVIMVGVKAFAENFIETSPTGEKSKVDIGPVNTIIPTTSWMATASAGRPERWQPSIPTFSGRAMALMVRDPTAGITVRR